MQNACHGIFEVIYNIEFFLQVVDFEFFSLRSNDMYLMAQHKYGVRVKQDARFCALMKRLGSAAVTVDLLEVKHTSPVKIIRCGQSRSKGASFIFYNSARLESLLRSFDERVANGDYESLPPLNSVNWELLSEEVGVANTSILRHHSQQNAIRASRSLLV